MALDVWSPKGRAANTVAQALGRRIGQEWGMTWIPTPEDGAARVDGVFVRSGAIRAVAEIKVRTCGREFIEARGGEYMVTAAKLDGGREIGQALGVPFILLVLLQGDLTAYWWRLTDQHGRWQVPFERRTTRTRETINGGQIERVNAFLPMRYAKSLDLSGEP